MNLLVYLVAHTFLAAGFYLTNFLSPNNINCTLKKIAIGLHLEMELTILSI
mgnify:CR=1 FL=1